MRGSSADMTAFLAASSLFVPSFISIPIEKLVCATHNEKTK